MSGHHHHHHHHAAPAEHGGAQALAMRLSLGASFLMLGGKTCAAWMTGSDAILSDASESVVHMAATAFAAFSLWYAAQPPDRQHPYGHGKMAYFSAGFEGALIGAAGVGIVIIAARSLVQGHQVQQLGWGLAITGALGLVNLALGLYLVRTGRQSHNLVLEANGKHVLSDMWTSLAVVVGVALVWLTGLLWLDSVVAIGAGLHILREGGALVRDSFTGLMERADEAQTRLFLDALDRARREGLVVDYHQLHHRQVHHDIWLEVHLLLPQGVSLALAHERANQVEAYLRACLPEQALHITTHLEPEDHERVHPGGHDLEADPLHHRLAAPQEPRGESQA
jgi:cation diffusion facilitator family transporter